MQLKLKNIGIIEKATIEIKGLTVIAGNNDSGKSTVGKVVYSITKAFEDSDLIFEKSKAQSLERYFRDFYMLLRREINLKENKELRKYIDKFMFYRRVDNKKLFSLMRELKIFIEENDINLKLEIKNKLEENFNKIESLFNKSESKNNKLIKSINAILLSEFKNKLNNVHSEKSTITISEGKNQIINLSIEDNTINTEDKIDEIFPFESSVFIETPFILTYKEALEDSGIIYHIDDLLNKLKIPIIDKKDNFLDVSKIINGNIVFEEERDDFVFEKTINGNKRTIQMLNTASGIKSLGILQILDKSGEFNKDLLLVIDEPEVHLHPDWQVEYAKLLVKLVKNGIRVLITSHSPYLIEALNKFSKDEKIDENKIKFYLSESNKDGKAIIVDKTKDKSEIFDKLSKPFERLVFGE